MKGLSYGNAYRVTVLQNAVCRNSVHIIRHCKIMFVFSFVVSDDYWIQNKGEDTILVKGCSKVVEQVEIAF